MGGAILAWASIAGAAEQPLYGVADTERALAVLERNCQSCHARGVANAPRIGVAEDWAERLAQRDLEAVIENAYNGYGRMPPRGYCRDCSREDIAAAVLQMLPESFRAVPEPEKTEP